MNPALLNDLSDRAARLAESVRALRDLLRGAGCRLELSDDPAEAWLRIPFEEGHGDEAPVQGQG